MNRYEALIPRAVCALASVAMTALVLSLTVLLPATSDSGVERIIVVGHPIRDEPMVRTSETPSATDECKPSPAAASA